MTEAVSNQDFAVAYLGRDPRDVERVYVGSPLGAPTLEGVRQNMLRAMFCVRLLVEEGYAAIAPHSFYPLLLDEHNPAHRALGIQIDLALMAGCHKVILFTPDGTSATMTSGMVADYEHATALGLPVEFRVWPEVPEEWRPCGIGLTVLPPAEVPDE